MNAHPVEIEMLDPDSFIALLKKEKQQNVAKESARKEKRNKLEINRGMACVMKYFSEYNDC